MLTAARSLHPEDDAFTVVVDVRGTEEVIRWHPDHVKGSPTMLRRLGLSSEEQCDPVAFLDAVRRCFGERADVRVRG